MGKICVPEILNVFSPQICQDSHSNNCVCLWTSADYMGIVLFWPSRFNLHLSCWLVVCGQEDQRWKSVWWERMFFDMNTELAITFSCLVAKILWKLTTKACNSNDIVGSSTSGLNAIAVRNLGSWNSFFQFSFRELFYNNWKNFCILNDPNDNL